MLKDTQGSATQQYPIPSSRSECPARPSRARYCVLVLGFMVGLVMFLDRACMGAATPSIMREFRLDKIAMGWSVSAFNWTYALFQIPGGWLADRFGSRIVLTAAIMWWSVFTVATGGAFSAASLAVTRGLFGMGEAAAWPAASRSLLRWLPVDQRAFGQGFQHSGSRLGAAFAPTMVVFLIARSGWRAVFYLFGFAGILVAIAWYLYYRDFPQDHFGVNRKELRMLEGALRAYPKTRAAVPWRRILRSRDLLCLSLAYFCYGWVFWMYLQWLPTYLAEVRHFTQIKMGVAASLPLIAATIMNMAGGWLSDSLARQWGNLRRGRVVVSVAGFTIAGIAILPGVLVNNPAAGLACLTLALAGLELTVPVSWALCLDIAGDFSGSVTGVMNTLGNLGGAVSAVMIGYLATIFGWTVPFVVSSLLCMVAALLVTRIDPTRSAVEEMKAERVKA
jgi:MFS transporter, ACS family, glucarate transporter